MRWTISPQISTGHNVLPDQGFVTVIFFCLFSGTWTLSKPYLHSVLWRYYSHFWFRRYFLKIEYSVLSIFLSCNNSTLSDIHNYAFQRRMPHHSLVLPVPHDVVWICSLVIFWTPTLEGISLVSCLGQRRCIPWVDERCIGTIVHPHLELGLPENFPKRSNEHAWR